MNEFFDHLGSDLREIGAKAKAALDKLMGKGTTDANGSVINANAKSNYEINLVPDVKMQMIRAQKTRNLVLFICIVVSSVAVGAVVVLFGIKSGQDIAISSQDKRIELMSNKLNSYNELGSLVTFQNQLTGIAEVNSQKTVLSRVFGALGVMLPQGQDSVRLSQLNINMENNLIQMEGQADARTDPLIDYRVLESFKKGVALTKYDYGRYVDADGTEIPTYCISETDAEGNAYKTGDSYYAWWNLTIEGCEASQRGGEQVEGAKFFYSSSAAVEKGIPGQDTETMIVCDENNENCVEQQVPVDQDPENPEGNPEESGEPVDPEDEDKIVPLRVKVWRTPQFTEWLNAGRMTLEGDISNIEHFASQCFAYSGTRVNNNVRWVSTNDCLLSEQGLDITSSSNGRDESNNLVLKFTASATLAEKFFEFSNKHMIAIGPLGQNVTDSYVQIGNMFVQEAKECEPDDTECLSNSSNRGDN